jgi:hypothetical protein
VVNGANSLSFGAALPRQAARSERTAFTRGERAVWRPLAGCAATPLLF